MSEPTRYDPDWRLIAAGDANDPEVIMVPDAAGDFVTYAEYATLRAKIERQDAALERLSERAEAAESAVDVLEKRLAAERERAASESDERVRRALGWFMRRIPAVIDRVRRQIEAAGGLVVTQTVKLPTPETALEQFKAYEVRALPAPEATAAPLPVRMIQQFEESERIIEKMSPSPHEDRQ